MKASIAPQGAIFLFSIRPASAADLAAISAIYNYYVTRATCTFALVEETLEDRRVWFEGRNAIHPVLVAEEAGQIVGWASLSEWNKRGAYAKTVESSIYIQHAHHRRGIGKVLMNRLLELATELKLHSVIAGITTDQNASMELHRGLGFVEVARFKEIGFKFGKWLDVHYFQKMIES